MLRFALLFLLLLSSVSIPAAVSAETGEAKPTDPRTTPIVATLSQLSFIAGSWRGEIDGAVIEERWSPPEGDNMIGMFRLVRDGEGVFYEFMTIAQAGDTPVLRIRHFGQGLEAWEEKDALDPYPLVELDSSRAVFENVNGAVRLTYERDGADILTITLEHKEDGNTRTEIFTFIRRQ